MPLVVEGREGEADGVGAWDLGDAEDYLITS